jgi:ribonuclease D
MNDENLISLADRTTEEQREIARMGGIRSGEVRRERKRLREALAEAMQMPDEDNEELSNVEVIAAAVVRKAKDGDMRAVEFCRDTCEGKPRNTVEVSTPAIPQSTYDEIERLLMGDD